MLQKHSWQDKQRCLAVIADTPRPTFTNGETWLSLGRRLGVIDMRNRVLDPLNVEDEGELGDNVQKGPTNLMQTSHWFSVLFSLIQSRLVCVNGEIPPMMLVSEGGSIPTSQLSLRKIPCRVPTPGTVPLGCGLKLEYEGKRICLATFYWGYNQWLHRGHPWL